MLFLAAALFSNDADAARVVVHTTPVVVHSPHVVVTVGHTHTIHKHRVLPPPKPCKSFRNLPPAKRPPRCK